MLFRGETLPLNLNATCMNEIVSILMNSLKCKIVTNCHENVFKLFFVSSFNLMLTIYLFTHYFIKGILHLWKDECVFIMVPLCRRNVKIFFEFGAF